jgi:hypothetical protein
MSGRFKSESIDKLITFRGSALYGNGDANLFQLSNYTKNVQDPTGVGPIGMGNSQALAGNMGDRKVVALGDSNGFTAMAIAIDDNSTFYSGMNLEGYEWKQFVLNVMHWLAGLLE